MADTDRILDLLAQVTETPEVRTRPDLALFDLQILDSMKTVELIVLLGQELGLDISPAEFERETWATPALFVADLQRRLSETAE
jgi:D-alanine--poly(phosphoribitol) ligase subunit 2